MGDIHVRRWVVVLAVCAALTAHSAVADVVQNDAASGADAGNSMSAPLRLARGYGYHQGNLTDSDGTDWYKAKTSTRHDPVCVSAGVDSHGLLVSSHLVAVANDDAREIVARPVPLRTNFMGVASPGLQGALVGVQALGGVVGVSGYDFNVLQRAASLGSGDGGSGADAGNTSATAVRFSADCVMGTLDPAAGDAVDVYRFDGRAGDKVALSLADSIGAATVSFLSPGGDLLGRLTSANDLALSLPSTGTYTLSASVGGGAGNPVTYILAACSPNCEPPPVPCEPACIAAIQD
ncbi:MAG TPA: hypothetical protein VHH36_02660 [Candidatus Thermoplasmatota archaeon]|nr:hypothetical protein [Candidatus Thermoplasmatota archaeon]